LTSSSSALQFKITSGIIANVCTKTRKQVWVRCLIHATKDIDCQLTADWMAVDTSSVAVLRAHTPVNRDKLINIVTWNWLDGLGSISGGSAVILIYTTCTELLWNLSSWLKMSDIKFILQIRNGL
jgi:hypothetical protein